MNLREFVLARTAEAEAAGTMPEVDATQRRRDVVRHGEDHICDDGARRDPTETLDSVDDHDWCDWMRAVGAQYAGHPDYNDRWRPWGDPYWDELLD